MKKQNIYRFDGFLLDVRDRKLQRDGLPLNVGPKVFDALEFLLENAGMLVERPAIRDHLWPGQIVEDGTLTRVIADLRKALGDVGEERRYIETVPKFGYRFTAAVEIVEPAQAPPPVAPLEPALAGAPAPDLTVSGDGVAVPVPRTVRRLFPWAVAACLAVPAFLFWHSASASLPRLALTIVLPEGSNEQPEVSPDGTAVLFRGNGGVRVRRLDSLEPVVVRGSQRTADAPFWSPDSKYGIFFIPGSLVKIRIPDGVPQLIAKVDGATRGGSWSDKGTILIVCDGRLYAVPASGGQLKPVDMTGVRPGNAKSPQFLAGSDEFLFLWFPENGEGPEVYLASLHDGKAVKPVLLMKSETPVRYTPSHGGRILFLRDDVLYSQKLDRKARQLSGEAEVLQRGVGSTPGITGAAGFSISLNGVVAWRAGRVALNQVTMFDRQGKEIGTTGPPGAFPAIALSPDETQILTNGRDSWLLRAGQPGNYNLGPRIWLVWSHDGSHMLGERQDRLVERAVDGTGEVHDLGAIDGKLQDISPEGKRILIKRAAAEVVMASVDQTERNPIRRVIAPASENPHSPGFSPDGNWIVYAVGSGDGVTQATYVQPASGLGLRRQIAGFGAACIWRKDGREIVIVEKGTMKVWSVRVDVTPGGPRFAPPEFLFSGLRWPTGATGGSQPLEVSRDGSRIFFAQGPEHKEPGLIQISTGWPGN